MGKVKYKGPFRVIKEQEGGWYVGKDYYFADGTVTYLCKNRSGKIQSYGSYKAASRRATQLNKGYISDDDKQTSKDEKVSTPPRKHRRASEPMA